MLIDNFPLLFIISGIKIMLNMKEERSSFKIKEMERRENLHVDVLGKALKCSLLLILFKSLNDWCLR